jgi:hypothetical protein
MSRTLPGQGSATVAKVATRPAYLLRLALENGSPAVDMLAATWDSTITWNSETWIASGIEVKNLTRSACTIEFPLGENEPWLAPINVGGTRGRSIQIYQHYTDTTASPQAWAVLMFTGVMDMATITDKITVTAQEKSRATSFPPESVDQPKFTHFLTSGSVIVWGGGTITVR